MYVQKDTYTYKHHTDMSVLNTYMSVFNTDMSECACICLNVYVFYFHWDSIVFLLSLYVVCFFAIDTSTYIHVWICMYDVCIVSVFCLNSASILSYIQAHTYMYVCACILNEFSARFVPIHTDTCIQWRQATGKQQCFYWKISSTMFIPPQQGQPQGQELLLRRIVPSSPRQTHLLQQPPPVGLGNADENPSKN